MDEKTFMINEPFLEDVNTIFLYGQEVKDYRSIDTDQINVMMLSAFQEIQKKLDKQEKEINDLYLSQSKYTSLNILTCLKLS